MQGKKNDYSMSFYNGEDRTMFLEYVHNTNKAIIWVNSKGIQHLIAKKNNCNMRFKVCFAL